MGVAACLFLLVLPSLALADIVWWGTAVRTALSQLRISTQSSQSARPLPLITARHGLEVSDPAAMPAKAEPNMVGDIIVHKVKTQPIHSGAWTQHGQESGAIQTSTEPGPLQ